MQRGKVETDGLENVPRDVEAHAIRHRMRWSRRNNILGNDVYFDSRTSEWRSFLSHLCSSVVGNAEVVMLFHRGGSAHPDEHTPAHMYACWPHDTTAFDIIAKSQLCVDVNFNSMTFLIVRMRPIKEALPFILDVLSHPRPRSEEARLAKGYYVRSVDVYLKDFRVGVDVYRDGKKGDPTH